MKPSKIAVAISISLPLLAAVVALRSPDANGTPAPAAAAELVVSSARDAGPQTLRDAILAADRLSGHAHILVRAKLIALDSPLPAPRAPLPPMPARRAIARRSPCGSSTASSSGMRLA